MKTRLPLCILSTKQHGFALGAPTDSVGDSKLNPKRLRSALLCPPGRRKEGRWEEALELLSLMWQQRVAIDLVARSR